MKAPLGAVFALVLLLPACSQSTLSHNEATAVQVETTLADAVKTADATPAGASVVKWIKALEGRAEAAVARFNRTLPGGGLTLDNVKSLCAADNSVHSLLALVPASLTGGIFHDADEGLYLAIQGTCAIATAGKLPVAGDVEKAVTAWNDLGRAVKAAIPVH